jgi:hypothetical protein
MDNYKHGRDAAVIPGALGSRCWVAGLGGSLRPFMNDLQDGVRHKNPLLAFAARLVQYC